MGSFEVAGLSKSFRTGPPVLRDLSFRYEGAGAVGYLGPNGAGKTTTLKLLVGLLRPSRGHAYLNGIDPMVNRKRALWDVGALIETPEPYPTLNVHEALDAVGRARGLSRDDVDREVDRCHELLDLPPLGQRIGWLSKGQRQRVALAATLMGDPSVLLLDEPTSGLDPAERVLVRRLLIRLKRDHLVFMSSHQMLEVTEVCDRLDLPPSRRGPAPGPRRPGGRADPLAAGGRRVRATRRARRDDGAPDRRHGGGGGLRAEVADLVRWQ